MSDPAELSVASVVALVLGGVAAFVLAVVIAWGGHGHGSAKRAPTASTALPTLSAAPSASGGVLEDEIEYLLDTDEPAAPMDEP